MKEHPSHLIVGIEKFLHQIEYILVSINKAQILNLLISFQDEIAPVFGSDLHIVVCTMVNTKNKFLNSKENSQQHGNTL